MEFIAQEFHFGPKWGVMVQFTDSKGRPRRNAVRVPDATSEQDAIAKARPILEEWAEEVR